MKLIQSEINYFRSSNTSDSYLSLLANHYFNDEDSNYRKSEHSFHLAGNEEKEDNKKPIVKLRGYDSIILNERERNGILTHRIIEACSLCLERSARPGKFVLSKCLLYKKALRNIEIIKFHKYLKFLDLSRNELTDLSPLSYLPFLTHLNASHNLITKLLDFKAPINLYHVNFSYNLLEDINDLREFWSLAFLDLSQNCIEKIDGLDALKYLNYLDLSYNKISTLENLRNLPILSLNLSNNTISSTNGSFDLSTCHNLTYVSISHNDLNTFNFLKGLKNIEVLDLSNNKLDKVDDLLILSGFSYLSNLDLSENPITTNACYVETCITIVPKLNILDGYVINPEAKAKVTLNLKGMPETARAYSSSATAHLTLLNFLKTPEINTTVMPCYNTFSSLILLVGPLCSKKKVILAKLKEHFKNKLIKLGICHTTRPKSNLEVDGHDYHFVSSAKFKKLLVNGKFIGTSAKLGFFYGICYDEIQKISEEPGILLFHTDLTCALEIRQKYYNSKLILAIASNPKVYKHWLTYKYAAYQTEIQNLLCYSVRKKQLSNILEDLSDIFSQPSEASMKLPETGMNAVEPVDESQEYDVTSIISSSVMTNLMRMTSFQHSSSDVMEGQQSFIKKDLIPSGPHPPTVSFLAWDTTSERKSKISVVTRKGVLKNALKATKSKESSICNALLNSDYNAVKRFSECFTVTADTSASAVGTSIASAKERKLSTTIRVPSNIEEVCAGEASFNNYKCVSEMVKSEDKYLLSTASEIGTDHGAQVAMDYFVENKLKVREQYIELYQNNPGLFYNMIYTDQEDIAIETLKEACIHSIRLEKKNANKYCQMNATLKPMMEEKLKTLFNMIK